MGTKYGSAPDYFGVPEIRQHALDLLTKQRWHALGITAFAWTLILFGAVATAIGLCNLKEPAGPNTFVAPARPKTEVTVTIPVEKDGKELEKDITFPLPSFEIHNLEDPAAATMTTRDYATVSTGLVGIGLGFAVLSLRPDQKRDAMLAATYLSLHPAQEPGPIANPKETEQQIMSSGTHDVDMYYPDGAGDYS